MAKEMANLMALVRKPATKLQQTDTSLGEPRKWSNTTRTSSQDCMACSRSQHGTHTYDGGITMVTVAMHLDLIAVRWVVAPTAIVPAAEVMLEVEFAGDNPAGGTSEDGVHRDCKVRRVSDRPLCDGSLLRSVAVESNSVRGGPN
ncbi:hypothetical protein EDC04DRAFT_2609505 [Pisolithus marmoratus]|nr:hypothetical protein EDC04DRAFT_2609505 [Pisolithus marmoratus]